MNYIISVCGFDVQVTKYKNGSYFHPVFNGNAEFKVNSKGFRALHSYLRNVKYFSTLLKPFTFSAV